MNLFCSCLLCCYLLCLFLLSPIIIHMSTLCHFNIGGVDSQSQSRVPTGGGVLICQFYLLLLKYHHKFSLRLLKMEDRFLSHFGIRCRLEKNVSGWLLSTTLRSDDHHRVIDPCRNNLNRCKCFFWDMIDSFWRCFYLGYTCLCICYRVGMSEG